MTLSLNFRMWYFTIFVVFRTDTCKSKTALNKICLCMMIMMVMMIIIITPYILGSICSAKANRAYQMFEADNLNQT